MPVVQVEIERFEAALVAKHYELGEAERQRQAEAEAARLKAEEEERQRQEEERKRKEFEKVRMDEERSDELRMLALGTKAVRARTSAQDAPPP